MSQTKPPIDDDDDDFELELEPVDPEILRLEQERAQKRTEAAVSRIDINEVYDQAGPHSDLEVDWSRLRQFRFTTQHLLVLTAVLALVLTVYRLSGGAKTVLILAVASLAGGWWWASRLERKQNEARARRQAEFRGEVAAETADWFAAERGPRTSFRFSFSTRDLLITTGAAAVTLGLLQIFSPAVLSSTLGVVALAGLVAHAKGFDPPRQVVLGWWILLVMYLAFGIVAVVCDDANAADRAPRTSTSLAEAAGQAATRNCGAAN